MNVGLLIVAEIFLLPFVSAETSLPNRCPKENPYPFENQTFCCSRPVDLQWRKEGYCYGKSQKCTHNEGCVNCKLSTYLPINLNAISMSIC